MVLWKVQYLESKYEGPSLKAITLGGSRAVHALGLKRIIDYTDPITFLPVTDYKIVCRLIVVLHILTDKPVFNPFLITQTLKLTNVTECPSPNEGSLIQQE